VNRKRTALRASAQPAPAAAMEAAGPSEHSGPSLDEVAVYTSVLNAGTAGDHYHSGHGS